ncbi:protein PML-like isoform X3 [Dreissena polymorpha]|nr:protein PML-like isoform X3 [Dreissena polymorpha]
MQSVAKPAEYAVSIRKKVNQKLGVSPGTFTSKLALLRDLQHKKRKAIAVTRAAKQRRIRLKLERHSKDIVQEVRGGPTYSSNIEDQDVELTTIPPPVPKPGPAGLDTTGKEFVFFDLETTGLERTSHIIQIAAVHTTGQFSTYVMPEKKMSLKASEITGVTVVGESMLVKGQTVTAVPIKSALTSFITFLQKCSPVILVGHNIESFDCKVLLHAIHSCGKMFEFQQNICGFLDTYKLLKEILPNMKSYKQENLVKDVIGESYMAHGALQDVLALQKLVNSVPLDQNIVNKYSFSYERAILAYNVSLNVASNIKSLQTMIDKKVMSQGVARKAAGSGLQLKHLRTVSKRNGLSGLRSLLSEVTNGQIRVTKSEKIICAIASYLLPDI